MTEIQKILTAYDAIDFSFKRGALATVVKLFGSSYRRPGARMIMTTDGRWTGAISGGCLEGDALRRARDVIVSGKPAVVRYDTMDDDANELGVGLGCNGIIDVLIEPLSGTSDVCIEALRTHILPDATTVLPLVFRSDNQYIPIGKRWLYDGLLLHGDTSIITDLKLDCITAYETKKYSTQLYSTPSGEVEVFIEVIKPQTRLVIFGSGYDASPVAELAKTLGWNVTVTDDCAAKTFPFKFPSADLVCHLHTEAILNNLTLNENTVCIVMSHNYHYDLSVVKQLLQTEVHTIGILGPKKRWQKMLNELSDEGIELTQTDIEKIYSPIGLDIGAETPEEIAVSIIAEIQSILTKTTASSLRAKAGTIHEQEDVLFG
ncbi:MAG: XdhC family protein [Ignavibacteriae bacterium]|nr:XdhC family protein [Ignavibacteriota bacterium]